MTGRQSQKSDHDILITLVETVNLQHKAITEQISGVKNELVDMKRVDLKELRDSTAQRVDSLEDRIDAYDKLSAEIQPMKLHEQVKENTRWINDFKITWRAVMLMTGGISAVITFILTTLIHVFNLLGRVGGK